MSEYRQCHTSKRTSARAMHASAERADAPNPRVDQPRDARSIGAFEHAQRAGPSCLLPPPSPSYPAMSGENKVQLNPTQFNLRLKLIFDSWNVRFFPLCWLVHW